MKYDLYNDDLRENPRQTESSVVVLPVWTREQDAYVPVFPVKGSPPEVARQFASITAERIFFRRKILGYYDAENDFVGNRIIREARPFGENGPTLAMLLDVGTTAAMTYVPLASAQSGGESVLARLYCVSGLEGSYPLPFNCEDSRKWFGYNWFLSGCDTKPIGTSWQLAAEVLAFAVGERHAPLDIRQRLATQYVFTGTVGRDSKVMAVNKIAEKTALGRVPEYVNLHWILPRGNQAEAGMVNAKPVATLDDAYEYVIGLGPETENLHELVRDGVDGGYLGTIYKQLRTGADANAIPRGGRNARQMIMANIQRKIVGLIRREGLKERPVLEIQNEIRKSLAPEWDAEKASSYYGNDPLLFFLAARSGDDKLLETLRVKMDIDAIDRDGETALDFAIEAGDRVVEKRLRRAGARHRGIYSLNSKRIRAFLRDPEAEIAVDGGKFIMAALEAGLDPLAETDFGTDENGKPVKRERTLWDNEKAEKDPWNKSPESEYSYPSTSVLKEAILIKSRKLVEKCLESLKKASRIVPGEYIELANKYSSPMVIKVIREFHDVSKP